MSGSVLPDHWSYSEHKVVVHVTNEVFERVMQRILAEEKNPPLYHAVGFNCVDWAETMYQEATQGTGPALKDAIMGLVPQNEMGRTHYYMVPAVPLRQIVATIVG